ncbi:unnamed protein product [Mytilus coruscus]|uniref:Uncharacterized protein n=1 Tax=Mytilus coruscus TaxID=42192 RepID=A0A6J8DD91_MYTCO|nr:unnamed protein product [Mytilus coruscus]
MDLMSKITNKVSTLMSNKEKTLCDQFSHNVQDSFLRIHLKQIVRSQPHLPFLGLHEEAIMWSEEEEYKDKRYNTKTKSETTDTVPEEPAADVCTSKDKTDSSEQSDKFNQLLGIVQKQSEQIEALTKSSYTQSNSRLIIIVDTISSSHNKILCYVLDVISQVTRLQTVQLLIPRSRKTRRVYREESHCR